MFAVVPLTGNALAVVPDADALDGPTMRAIAREFNQSETTFLVRPTAPGATWRLRSFTPGGHEVGGAGHNALGAWLWLAHAGRVGTGTFTQQIGGDVLPVEVTVAADEPTRVTMAQSAPGSAASRPTAPSWPPRSGSATTTSCPTARPRSCRPAPVTCSCRSSAARSWTGSPSTRPGCWRCWPPPVVRAATSTPPRRPSRPTARAYARFFNPTMGIVEDPATGTAAGPLAAFLTRHGDVRAGRPVLIQQGDATGRPSRLQIEVDGDRVRITGTGLVVGTGHLLRAGNGS